MAWTATSLLDVDEVLRTKATQRLYLLLPNHKCPQKDCPFHPPEEATKKEEEPGTTTLTQLQETGSGVVDGGVVLAPPPPRTGEEEVSKDYLSEVTVDTGEEESMASDYESSMTLDSGFGREELCDLGDALFLALPASPELEHIEEQDDEVTTLTSEHLTLEDLTDHDADDERVVTPVPLKDGHEVIDDVRHRLAYKEGVATLQITDLEPQDAGSYSCEAINNLGATETTAELHVEEVRHRRKRKEEGETVAETKVARGEEVGAPEDNVPPEFTLPLVDQVKQVGEDVELSVTVTGRPEPEVTWYCGEVRVTASPRHVMEQARGLYRLTVRQLIRADAGEWRCELRNASGRASCTCDLQVIESIPDDHRPPRFPRELEGMTVTRGSKVQLECEVIGYPEPAVQWYKDRQRIGTDKHYEVRRDDNLCLLLIHLVDYDDSGAYMCRAQNDAGTATTEAYVRVQSVRETALRVERSQEPARVSQTPTRRYKLQVPPDFTAKLKNKRVPAGATLHFTCSVTGIPEPSVRWLKDGREIFEGAEYSMRNNYGLLSLEVANAQARQAGTYTCEASNQEGTASCSATLQVEGEEELEAVELEFLRPRFLSPLEDIWANEGEDVTFLCKAVGKPLPTFKWQKDMLELSLSNRIQMTTDSKGGASLTIRKVKASDAGLYVVQAQSHSGRTKSSASLRVRGKSGSPPSSPEVVQRTSFEGGFASLQQMAVPGRPPNFSIMLPARLEVHENEKLRLDCSVQGFPTPIVTWNKSYRGLMYGPRHRIMFVGSLHTLEIPQTMARDSGEYIVRATNAFGCVETSCNVTILPPRKAGEPERLPELMHLEAAQRIKQDLPTSRGKAPFFIKHLPHSIEVMEGTNIRLDCILRGGVELVQWTQDGAQQAKEDLEREGFQGHFVPARDTPGGGAGAASSSGSSSASSGALPFFKTSLRDLALAPGSEAVFECVTSAPAEGTWYKNGKPLAPGDAAQMTSDGTRHRLILAAISGSDEGDYTFEVSSAAGSASSSAILTLHESQKVTMTKSSRSKFSQDLPAETTAMLGDSVTLTCAVADPITEVFWKKDDRRLSFSSKRLSSGRLRDGTVTLQVDQLLASDAGTYSCTAIMSDGSHVCTATHLALTEPAVSRTQSTAESDEGDVAPVFVKPLQDQKLGDGDTVILRCSVEGNPRPQITWYRNGTEILDNQDILISTIGSECKLQILDVYPEDEGHYSCTAKNSAGEATTTCYITVEDAYLSGDSESSSYGAKGDRNIKTAAAARR